MTVTMTITPSIMIMSQGESHECNHQDKEQEQQNQESIDIQSQASIEIVLQTRTDDNNQTSSSSSFSSHATQETQMTTTIQDSTQTLWHVSRRQHRSVISSDELTEEEELLDILRRFTHASRLERQRQYHLYRTIAQYGYQELARRCQAQLQVVMQDKKVGKPRKCHAIIHHYRAKGNVVKKFLDKYRNFTDNTTTTTTEHFLMDVEDIRAISRLKIEPSRPILGFELFSDHSRHELYDALLVYHDIKLSDGKAVHDHIKIRQTISEIWSQISSDEKLKWNQKAQEMNHRLAYDRDSGLNPVMGTQHISNPRDIYTSFDINRTLSHSRYEWLTQ
jgi:hypothetical protein